MARKKTDETETPESGSLTITKETDTPAEKPVMVSNPRSASADSLDGSSNATGAVSHADEPQTHRADDVTNEPTGAVQQMYPDHDPDFAETREGRVTKTIDGPAKQGPVSGVEVETA